MKMSKSESGKLGAEKSALISALKKQANIEAYMNDPKKCGHCNSVIDYAGRYKKFCGSSCAASHNNTKRLTVSDKQCLQCKKTIGKTSKYCSVLCQRDFESAGTIRKWLAGEPITGLSAVRRHIKEQQGGKCAECGITEWNGKAIILELEHKDGNSDNNTPENLCFLCPNCHSQTSTYKGKNKGKGRHSRRTRYQSGKSY
jgi:hypothetical protein